MIDEKFKKDHYYDQEMVEYRGYVLARTISVEHHIDIIIVKHRFPDSNLKANEFFSNIISEMSTSKKIETLKDVLKKMGEASDQNAYNILCDNLSGIFDFRNMIAHWKWSYKEDGDHFVLRKHAEKSELIDNSRLEKFVSQCIDVTVVLSRVYGRHFIMQDVKDSTPQR